MLQTIWKGAITFGLVSIPIRLHAATEHKDIKFRYLHVKCNTPLKYQRICPYCNEEVFGEDIVRGYEYEKNRFVIIDEEDLEKIPHNMSKTIDILHFVELAQIDPIYFDRTYFLSPDKVGQRAYNLLHRAMKETGKIAIAKIVIREKEYLAALRVYDRLLVMETMYYPDEIRTVGSVPGLAEDTNIKEKELEIATTLINNLATDFEPEKYHDTYREALSEVIQAKIAGKEVTAPKPPDQEKIVDLMEALKASIELTQKNKDTGKVKEKEKHKPARTG